MKFLENSERRFTNISSGFGMRDDPMNPGHTEDHSGIDVSAEEGSGIGSAADGIVVYSYNNGDDDYGYTIMIEHIGDDQERSYTLYGHLDGVNMARVGQQVKKDDIIGQVGHSGRTQGGHVHFEVLVPHDTEKIRVNGDEIIRPIFKDDKGNKYGIISSYYGNFYRDLETGRVPLGIPGGVRRENPTTFGNWPDSGSSDGSQSSSDSHTIQGMSIIDWMLQGYPEDTIKKAKKEAKRDMEEIQRKKRSGTSSSSGETLEWRGDKVWRIEADGSSRGFVKEWSQ